MSDNAWQTLLTLLTQQKDNKALETVLSILLSHEERRAISDRLTVFHELLAGDGSQREISAQTGVSIAKITRTSNVLKQLTDAEKQALIVNDRRANV